MIELLVSHVVDVWISSLDMRYANTLTCLVHGEWYIASSTNVSITHNQILGCKKSINTNIIMEVYYNIMEDHNIQPLLEKCFLKHFHITF